MGEIFHQLPDAPPPPLEPPPNPPKPPPPPPPPPNPPPPPQLLPPPRPPLPLIRNGKIHQHPLKPPPRNPATLEMMKLKILRKMKRRTKNPNTLIGEPWFVPVTGRAGGLPE